MTDVNGITPLKNAIISKNFRAMEELLNFVKRSEQEISMITQDELSLLLENPCKNLISFLE